MKAIIQKSSEFEIKLQFTLHDSLIPESHSQPHGLSSRRLESNKFPNDRESFLVEVLKVQADAVAANMCKMRSKAEDTAINKNRIRSKKSHLVNREPIENPILR
jgi:hypothetical protein